MSRTASARRTSVVCLLVLSGATGLVHTTQTASPAAADVAISGTGDSHVGTGGLASQAGAQGQQLTGAGMLAAHPAGKAKPKPKRSRSRAARPATAPRPAAPAAKPVPRPAAKPISTPAAKPAPPTAPAAPAAPAPKPAPSTAAVTPTPVTAVAQGAATRAGRGSASSYSFSSTLDGQPVRWDPCAPIRWTSNTASGPVGGLEVLKAAVGDIATETGTTWVYAGETAEVPRNAYLPTRAQAEYPPVLIGWTDGRSSDLLAGQAGNVLGMTRTAWFGVRHADGSAVAATRAAVIALDSTDRLPLRGATSWQAVARHEVGHAFGLGHVSDPSQLMNPVLPRDSGELQAGDRAGLARLGREQGCVRVG